MINFDLKFGIGSGNLEFSDEYKYLITESCQILIEVVNSAEFQENVLNYEWHHKRRGRKIGFNHTNASREEVLSKLLSGNDKFSDEFVDDHNEIDDGDIDIWIFPYYAKKKIVGSTNPSTYRTWLNLNYWNRRIISNKVNPILTKIEIAENILHEYCHNLGFGHRGNKPHKYYNRHSVPYALGDIFNKIALKNDQTKTKLMSDFDFENEFVVDCSFTESENNNVA